MRVGGSCLGWLRDSSTRSQNHGMPVTISMSLQGWNSKFATTLGRSAVGGKEYPTMSFQEMFTACSINACGSGMGWKFRI